MGPFAIDRRILMAVLISTLSWGALNFGVPDTSGNMAFAQTIPAISQTQPRARDAATFEDDKKLNLACRNSQDPKMKRTQDACLCVTHVLKYELTLTEYRAAAILYGATGDREPLYQTLRDRKFSADDINVAEHMEKNLFGTSDFAERCANAKAYYKQ